MVRDLESGTYLKVHNHLGRGHRVHKDGSPLTKFVPGVSGCRNHHSGDYNTLAGGRYESWLEGNIPSRVKEKTDNPSPSNTLDRRRNDNKSEQKSAVHPSLSFTSSLSLRIKSKNSVRGPQHYAKLVELEQNDKQLEPGTLKEVLKAYHEMIEEKEAENFSLKKEEIPGSVRLQKPQERTVLASKYFSNKASYESLSPSPAQTLPLRLSKKKLQALPESFSLKRQYLHDRHLYFSSTFPTT